MLRHEKVDGSNYSLCNAFGSSVLGESANAPQVAMTSATAVAPAMPAMPQPVVAKVAEAHGPEV